MRTHYQIMHDTWKCHHILVKGIYFSNRGVEFYFGDFTIAERPLFEVDIPK